MLLDFLTLPLLQDAVSVPPIRPMALPTWKHPTIINTHHDQNNAGLAASMRFGTRSLYDKHTRQSAAKHQTQWPLFTPRIRSLIALRLTNRFSLRLVREYSLQIKHYRWRFPRSEIRKKSRNVQKRQWTRQLFWRPNAKSHPRVAGNVLIMFW